MFTIKKGILFLLFLFITVSLFTLNSYAAPDPFKIVANDESFDPNNDKIMIDIPWEIKTHVGFDGAFTPARSRDGSYSHIQLNGNAAYFYGYRSEPLADYLYYVENDSGEKTFSFNMNYYLYEEDEDFPTMQYWHSMRSFGFLVNCIKNGDGTISGYYFAFEGTRQDDRRIAIRMFDHINLNSLHNYAVPISETRILGTMPLLPSMRDYFFEIKSSNKAFSIKKDGVTIYTFNLASANPSDIPFNYNGGNDFGFIVAYAGNEPPYSHNCLQLSCAEFTNISIITKTVTPSSTLDVRFVDYNTKNNAKPVEIRGTYQATGYVGQNYIITPPAIDGYTYVGASASLTGAYKAARSEIILYYSKDTDGEWEDTDKNDAYGTKIPSNAHSYDAGSGVVFYWDVKQKDDCVLVIAPSYFEKNSILTLVANSGSEYKKMTFNKPGTYDIKKWVNDKGKVQNINMIWVRFGK